MMTNKLNDPSNDKNSLAVNIINEDSTSRVFNISTVHPNTGKIVSNIGTFCIYNKPYDTFAKKQQDIDAFIKKIVDFRKEYQYKINISFQQIIDHLKEV